MDKKGKKENKRPKLKIVSRTPENAEDPNTELAVVIHTPLQLIQAIDDKSVDVTLIDAKQRRGAVAELMRRGMRLVEIAELFKVSVATISKDKKRILRDMGQIVDDFDVKGFLGYIIEEAEWHIGVAKRMKDYRLSWQVILQLQVVLKEYGVLRPLVKPLGNNDEERKDPLEEELEKLTSEQLKRVQDILDEAIDVTPRTVNGEDDDD